MIREAQEKDASRILEMAARFVDETSYKALIPMKPEILLKTILNVLKQPNGTIFVSESDGCVTGMIAMLAYDHPFSGELTAFEIVWWVDPESRGDGVRLLKSAEKWARELGAKKVQMVSPNKRVSDLYERLGYSAVEISYQRSL